MSLEGNAVPNSALRGKVHALVIDKTLTIPGAAADALATREAINDAVEKGIGSEIAHLTSSEIKGICV